MAEGRTDFGEDQFQIVNLQTSMGAGSISFGAATNESVNRKFPARSEFWASGN